MIPRPQDEENKDEFNPRKQGSYSFQRVTTTEACEIIEFDANNEYYDDDETFDMNLVCSNLTQKDKNKEGETRSSPEDEFFRLCCLGLKIKFSEK